MGFVYGVNGIEIIKKNKKKVLKKVFEEVVEWEMNINDGGNGRKMKKKMDGCKCHIKQEMNAMPSWHLLKCKGLCFFCI